MNSTTPAQVGGAELEVNTSSDADKRREKMAEVAVVLKLFMCKRGKRSKKNNGDDDEECGRLTVRFMDNESQNDGWTSTSQRPDKRLQAKICTLSKLLSVSSKNEGTYLDSHANMVVCGKYCHILSRSGISATVSMFTDDVGILQIPIIDAIIAYNYPDTTKVWLLIVRNVLFVKSMNHTLIPRFILQEGGMKVNDRPKIHHSQGTPSLTDHIFGSAKHKYLISFKLSGIFSMFDSQKPTNDDFIDGTYVAITPEEEEWNPNSSQFDRNENPYTDVQGQMIQKNYVDADSIDDDDFMKDKWNQ